MASDEGVHYGRHDSIVASICIGHDRKLEDHTLRFREPDRDVECGMVHQVSCIVAHRYLGRVDEVDVIHVTEMAVCDAILERSAERACAIEVLREPLGPCGGIDPSLQGREA